jgi:hypothetical protein
MQSSTSFSGEPFTKEKILSPILQMALILWSLDSKSNRYRISIIILPSGDSTFARIRDFSSAFSSISS